MSGFNHDFDQDYAVKEVPFEPLESIVKSDSATQNSRSNFVSPDEIYECCKLIVNNGKKDAAIWILLKLVESYPDYAIAHNDLGVLYYDIGDKDKALTYYEKAALLQPENKTFQKNLADFYYVELHRVEDALRIYVKVLETDPQDIEVLLITGHICVSLRQFEDARIFYNRVLEIEPWNMDARENLDKIENMGNESINAVAKVLDNDNVNHNQASKDFAGVAPEKTLEDVQAMVSAGDNENAIKELEGLIVAHPDYAIAHNDLGVLYYNRRDKEKTLAHYEKAARLQPENITFRKNLADFYYVELHRVEDAMRIYVKILENDPQDIEALLITGHICISLMQFEDARIFYNRVLEIEPWNMDARENLGKIENMGNESINDVVNDLNTDDITQIWSNRDITGKSPEETLENVQSMLSAGHDEHAIRTLEDLVKEHPGHATAHNDLGALYYSRGDKERTLIHYEEAVRLQPENKIFQKNLADLYCVEEGRVEDALRIYVKVLEDDPVDIEALLSCGHISAGCNQTDDAKIFYNRVLEIEPWNFDARQSLDNLA